jgi:mRNA interferase HicA
MPTTAKEVIKRLLKDGWELKTINGSHHKYIKQGKTSLIVPYHNKELKKGLLKDLEKKSGLKLDNK